ncbi:MAG: DUF4190 domain-containing protein [Acetatifactor sp.]|jgi:hypothetical protein|nr:DUF4190 domain-containing protein [Acetatifactor sp.]
MDYQPNMEQQINNDKFSIASFVCGLLSLVLCCMVFFSIPLGALGILFAILSRRSNRQMNLLSKVGIWLSVVGILYGVFSFVRIVREIPVLLNDPAYVSMLDSYYEQLTGQTFFEYWENYGN